MITERSYKPIKEDRGWYFVEYHPPGSFKFANLYLTIIIENTVKNDIIAAMEKEAKVWLNLYPVPLLVSSFDNMGTPFDFREIKEQNSLMGFFDNEKEIRLYWKPLKDEEIPNTALDKEYMDSLYFDFLLLPMPNMALIEKEGVNK